MMVEDQSLSINVEAAEAAAKLSTSIEEKFRPAVIAFEARWRAWQADCVAIIAQERLVQSAEHRLLFAPAYHVESIGVWRKLLRRRASPC